VLSHHAKFRIPAINFKFIRAVLRFFIVNLSLDSELPRPDVKAILVVLVLGQSKRELVQYEDCSDLSLNHLRLLIHLIQSLFHLNWLELIGGGNNLPPILHLLLGLFSLLLVHLVLQLFCERDLLHGLNLVCIAVEELIRVTP